MIEVVATIAIMGILMAISVSGLTYYLSVKAIEGSANELKTQVRETQAMAVATGNTYRLDFSNTDSYFMQRRQGSEWINVRGPIDLESAVAFSGDTPPNFGGDRYLEFYAKGTCEDGSLMITGRFGEPRTLTLDGETVNVRIT